MSFFSKKKVFFWRRGTNTKRNKGKWLWGIIFFIMASIICFLGLYFIILKNGVSILEQQIDKFETTEATLIFDKNQQEIAKLFRENGNRESIVSQQIPPLLKQAFIATEDQRFESHAGVDIWSMGRAIVTDVIQQKKVQGGSTITQQLAKNVFLTSEKTFFRKATELSIALALEAKYSKDEILEKYLNRIYFGSGAYGIKAASKVYFNQSNLDKLDIWQIATLATLPKAPSRYSPISNATLSKERRAIVLKLMEEQGYITAEQQNEAEQIDYVAPPGNSYTPYASFVDYVIQEAEQMYGISEDELLTNGYRITTTLDRNAQTIIDQTYANPKFFQPDAKDGEKIQSAMVILDHKNGEIIGLIGGRDYTSRGYNRITSQRQPGSAIKPIAVYAPAIETGKWDPYSKLSNVEQQFGSGNQVYSPRNYDLQYTDQVTMFQAAKKSINVATVWLLDQIGVKRGYDFANELGLQLDPGDRNLSLALGGLTYGVSPMQMASAYSTFANDGIYNQPHAITSVVDRQDQVVATYKAKSYRVMNAKTAYYIRLLLEGAVHQGGTGVKAYFNRPLAGKTGSTGLSFPGLEKYDRDTWFVGFTPEWTAAVWQGFDKTNREHFVYVGSGSTALIFKEIMSKALAKKEVKAFSIPLGVQPLQEPIVQVTDLAAVLDSEMGCIKLTWSTIDERYAYEVYRQSDTEQQFQKIEDVAGTEACDSDIIDNHTYSYYVIAVRITDQMKSNPSASAGIYIEPGQLPSREPSETSTPEETTQPSAQPEESVIPEPTEIPNEIPIDSSAPTPTPLPTPSSHETNG